MQLGNDLPNNVAMGKVRQWLLKVWTPCRKLDKSHRKGTQDKSFDELAASVSGRVAEEELLKIFIPQEKFEEFETIGPEETVLSLQDYMYLYKYCSDETMSPGPMYQYKVYRFKADDKSVILEGWVPRSERNGFWKWPDY